MTTTTYFIGTQTNTTLANAVASNGYTVTVVYVNGSEYVVVNNGSVSFLQNTFTGSLLPIGSELEARLASIDVFFAEMQTVRTEETIEAEYDLTDEDIDNMAF